jgi:hypothetical protein
VIEACGVCNTCRNLKRIDKTAFDNMKKYKATVDIEKYRNAFNEYLNGTIKENNIKYITAVRFNIEKKEKTCISLY